MKTIFAAVLFLVAVLPAQSQSLQVVYETATVKDDTNNYDLESFVWIKNVSSSSQQVKVRRDTIHVANGHTNAFCWSVCYGEEQDVSPDVLVLKAGDTCKKFVGHLYAHGHDGETIIKYHFYLNSQPSDEVTSTITYTVKSPVDVRDNNEKVISDRVSIYPNPSSDVANVRYNSNAEQTITVRDMLGRTLSSTPVKGEGTLALPVQSYTPGMYLISMQENGKPIEIKPFIVNR